jgi:hypothetical protein
MSIPTNPLPEELTVEQAEQLKKDVLDAARVFVEKVELYSKYNYVNLRGSTMHFMKETAADMKYYLHQE